MHKDRHGLELSQTSPTAVRHYDAAVDHLLFFRAEVVAETTAALAEDPGSPMVNVLAAYLGLLGTEPDDVAAAHTAFAGFRPASPPTPREQAHLAAASTWLDGDLRGAGALLRELTIDHPRDVLALAVGHQIDFFTGDAASLRDRVGGSLAAWGPDDEHYGLLLGMYGFGLEESGHYGRSEETALAAVELNRTDVWGVHAVAHTYEMQGRFGDGVRFYDAHLDDWSTGNFLNVHNWWHYALYAIEAGATARALEVYDTVMGEAEFAMEMLDAAALLWRLYLDGDDQTGRWSRLADAWAPKMDEPYYAFNDMHAVMSYVGAGRHVDAEKLIDDRARWLVGEHPGVTNHPMTADIGLPVCRAMLAYGQCRYGDVVDLLYPIRYRVNEFGGSHAQRDAVQKTLVEAALRARRDDLARALISERINVRPCSPFNWLAQARLLESVGEAAAAVTARGRAADQVAAAGLGFSA